MTNEEFQKIVLEELRSMRKEMATKEELSEIKQSLTRMENDHGEKLSALYDAREVQMDVNGRILDTLSRMESKIDKITLKVAAHESALKRAK